MDFDSCFGGMLVTFVGEYDILFITVIVYTPEIKLFGIINVIKFDEKKLICTFVLPIFTKVEPFGKKLFPYT